LSVNPPFTENAHHERWLCGLQSADKGSIAPSYDEYIEN
jgi:hypothetical protein